MFWTPNALILSRSPRSRTSVLATRPRRALCRACFYSSLTYSSQKAYAASGLAVLAEFGLEDLVSTICTKNGIHTLENAMTLELQVHTQFDQLAFALEPTLNENEVLFRLLVYL